MRTRSPATTARLTVLGALLALIATACGTGTTDPDPGATVDAQAQLGAQVASFDLAAGPDQRLLVGVFRTDRTLVAGGEVEFRLAWLGDDLATEGEVTLSEPVTARFLPVPGNTPDVGDTPTFVEGRGAGVYEARVDLDRPGIWGLRVTAEVNGTTLTTDTHFPVLDRHRVPTVGEAAPRVDTPTIDTHDGPLVALDSRAQGDDATLPSPHLHEVSVPDAIDAGRPVVVLIATPVYCVSQFCGPITEVVSDLALEYADRAAFVHLEVWQDFAAETVNPHVLEWIFDEEVGGGEPWTFLVGPDGTIQARWDNVLDEDELVALLEALPAT